MAIENSCMSSCTPAWKCCSASMAHVTEPDASSYNVEQKTGRLVLQTTPARGVLLPARDSCARVTYAWMLIYKLIERVVVER